MKIHHVKQEFHGIYALMLQGHRYKKGPTTVRMDIINPLKMILQSLIAETIFFSTLEAKGQIEVLISLYQQVE